MSPAPLPPPSTNCRGRLSVMTRCNCFQREIWSTALKIAAARKDGRAKTYQRQWCEFHSSWTWICLLFRNVVLESERQGLGFGDILLFLIRSEASSILQRWIMACWHWLRLVLIAMATISNYCDLNVTLFCCTLCYSKKWRCNYGRFKLNAHSSGHEWARADGFGLLWGPLLSSSIGPFPIELLTKRHALEFAHRSNHPSYEPHDTGWTC